MSLEITLNPLLHQPVRTRLVMILKVSKETSFTDLKSALGVTDGNLDAHLKKLSAAGYIHTRFLQQKTGRMRTLYSLSDSGRTDVNNYLESLKSLLETAF